MGAATMGLGILAGGPGGGGILQRNPPSLDWTGTWAFAGATMMAAGVVFLILRFMKAGFKPVKC